MEPKGSGSSKSVATTVRQSIQRSDKRLWSAQDFKGLPMQAVTKELSRLNRAGVIRRQGKGVYYRPMSGSFGDTRPSRSATVAKQVKHVIHPAGLSAANLLGFTTQNVLRGEYATTATGTPTALKGAVVHPRRPIARAKLSRDEGALLEVLRDRANTSDLSDQETVDRMLSLLSDPESFKRLARAAQSEPPRVRAMLGAAGEQLGMSALTLDQLRRSLNVVSRYDFGKLRSLRFAKDWQAK